jgi:Na+/H+-translocating membrane pyrophosphatase
MIEARATSKYNAAIQVKTHFVMHKERDPRFHAVVVALVIIVVVLGFVAFANFIVAR